jgi:hypothetical protein
MALYIIKTSSDMVGSYPLVSLSSISPFGASLEVTSLGINTYTETGSKPEFSRFDREEILIQALIVSIKF